MLRVKLDAENRTSFVDDPFVSVVVSVREKDRPIGWQGFSGDCKAMVLCCDETAFACGVDTGLVVATVTVPVRV